MRESQQKHGRKRLWRLVHSTLKHGLFHLRRQAKGTDSRAYIYWIALEKFNFLFFINVALFVPGKFVSDPP